MRVPRSATPRKEDAVRGSTAEAMAWTYLTVPLAVLGIRDRATVCAICSFVIADELTHRMAAHGVTGPVAHDVPMSIGSSPHRHVQSHGRTAVLVDRSQKVGWQ